MTDFNEIANTPIDIEIAGIKLKARRPDMSSVFGEMESKIVSKVMETVRQGAELYGLVGADRLQFLSNSQATIPQGLELQIQAQNSLGSVDGVKALVKSVLKKDQPDITDEQIMNLVMKDPEGAGDWIAFLTGDKKGKPKVR